jgi:hypothetical protein
MIKIFASIPNYDFSINTGLAMRLVDATNYNTSNAHFIWFARTMSLLTTSFNQAWCEALNLREKEKLTHFLMIHADIIPDCPDWVNRLLSVMEETSADVVSAIIPIKDEQGLTSTGKDTDPWLPDRYSISEINQMPANFEAELINTGLMLVDFRKEWVAKINPPFTIMDKLIYEESKGWQAVCQPEDWYFSREVRRLGGRLVATQKVPVIHVGRAFFSMKPGRR